MYNVLEKNKLTVPKESLQRLGYMYMYVYMYIAGDLWLWLQILWTPLFIKHAENEK